MHFLHSLHRRVIHSKKINFFSWLKINIFGWYVHLPQYSNSDPPQQILPSLRFSGMLALQGFFKVSWVACFHTFACNFEFGAGMTQFHDSERFRLPTMLWV